MRHSANKTRGARPSEPRKRKIAGSVTQEELRCHAARVTDIGLCFDCLTDDDAQVPAVTTHKGTAVCEKCARERAAHAAGLNRVAEQTQERLANFPRPPGPSTR